MRDKLEASALTVIDVNYEIGVYYLSLTYLSIEISV